MRKFLIASASALILTACGNAAEAPAPAPTTAPVEKAAESKPGKKAVEQGNSSTAPKKAAGQKKPANANRAKLRKVLKAQSKKAKARYGARNPEKTLAFFGIEPGMAVGEALPGGGWYTKILVPYLGEEGKLVGIDYSFDMWPEFSFANEKFIEKKKTWTADFVSKAAKWAPADGAKISATTFGADSGDMAGQLDAVLFIRALHNLSRFETEGQYMTKALSKTHALLKPGGIVGVVQHSAPPKSDNKWANGSAGYLKQGRVIAAFDAAGFDLVKKSGLKAERMAIGESNRMTLLFKKR